MNKPSMLSALKSDGPEDQGIPEVGATTAPETPAGNTDAKTNVPIPQADLDQQTAALFAGVEANASKIEVVSDEATQPLNESSPQEADASVAGLTVDQAPKADQTDANAEADSAKTEATDDVEEVDEMKPGDVLLERSSDGTPTVLVLCVGVSGARRLEAFVRDNPHWEDDLDMSGAKDGIVSVAVTEKTQNILRAMDSQLDLGKRASSAVQLAGEMAQGALSEQAFGTTVDEPTPDLRSDAEKQAAKQAVAETPKRDAEFHEPDGEDSKLKGLDTLDAQNQRAPSGMPTTSPQMTSPFMSSLMSMMGGTAGLLAGLGKAAANSFSGIQKNPEALEDQSRKEIISRMSALRVKAQAARQRGLEAAEALSGDPSYLDNVERFKTDMKSQALSDAELREGFQSRLTPEHLEHLDAIDQAISQDESHSLNALNAALGGNLSEENRTWLQNASDQDQQERQDLLNKTKDMLDKDGHSFAKRLSEIIQSIQAMVAKVFARILPSREASAESAPAPSL